MSTKKDVSQVKKPSGNSISSLDFEDMVRWGKFEMLLCRIGEEGRVAIKEWTGDLDGDCTEFTGEFLVGEEDNGREEEEGIADLCILSSFVVII